jgi:type VI secretion system VasD/TssJ family lipoprotein
MGVKRLKFAELVVLGVLAVACGLAACAHAPPPPCSSPEPLRVNLKASPHLNPSEKGEALATVVRVYQLKGTGKIAVASFDDLLDHDKDTLGEDFVAVQEVTLEPTETLNPPLVRSPDATHVAVVALFRKPTGTAWRAIEKLPAPDPQYCNAPLANGKGPPSKDPTLRFEVYDNRIAATRTP